LEALKNKKKTVNANPQTHYRNPVDYKTHLHFTQNSKKDTSDHNPLKNKGMKVHEGNGMLI